MTSTSYAQNQGDDSFKLYDLRVEVICPPGKRIMCGAKEGDYFTLEGAMLMARVARDPAALQGVAYDLKRFVAMHMREPNAYAGPPPGAGPGTVGARELPAVPLAPRTSEALSATELPR